MSNVALYARVSTDDRDQNPESQLMTLRSWADLEGHAYDEFIDYASGNDMRGRVQWRELMKVTQRARPKYRIIAITEWSRLARSVRLGLEIIDDMKDHDVGIYVHRQQIDTSTPHGRKFATDLLSFAEMERGVLSERTREGMARARAQGVHVGRPRTRLTGKHALKVLEEHGGDWTAAADALKVSTSTLRRRVATVSKGTSTAAS